MLVIGLTGGIGTGKSLVSRILEEMGAAVVDADRVGHEVYTPHTVVWQEVVEAFGEDIIGPEGEIDRKRLGSIVFGDPGEMAKLNGIMHPRMAEMIHQRVQELDRQGIQVVVVEAAVLVDAGWDKLPWIDQVWVTNSPEQLVVARLGLRNNLAEEEVLKRVRSQLSFEERSRSADVVVENSGSTEELEQQVRSLWGTRVKGKVAPV